MLNEDVPPYCLPTLGKVFVKGKNIRGEGTVVKIHNPMLVCVVNKGHGSEDFPVVEEDVKLVLRIGNIVQVRDDASGNFVDAKVQDIHDHSHYVVALDDGSDNEPVLAHRKNLRFLEDKEVAEELTSDLEKPTTPKSTNKKTKQVEKKKQATEKS